MKVTIKSWTGVATWRWIANDDNCGICRMPFDASCPDCKIPGDDCPLGTRNTRRCPSPSPWTPSGIDARRMCARTSVRSSRCYHPSFPLLLIARCTRPFTGPLPNIDEINLTTRVHRFVSVWGQCSHCFHIHCIMKWLHSQQTNHICPMCRQEWKFKE
ncbi:Anaphase-promoting complex subunit 11 [Trachymyrmex zeteki]|uniref:Anaphase-promoting complex subunit 11 n=1 Tax=Mycetomoellerius zeteki TaxID=64791 RepID=A0A151WQD9_9HYME|nr:Anaphase-promoting complex subunit 11 [Trachymyrmex zeteki]